MRIPIQCDGKSVLLEFFVDVAKPTEVLVEVVNPNKQFTKYTSRKHRIGGNGQKFFVRMPQTPNHVLLIVTPKVRNGAEMYDTSLEVKNVKVSPLYKALNEKKWKNDTVRNFIDFAQKFSENAGILSSRNSIYVSDNWQFRIDYLDELLDSKGRATRTPARIDGNKGIMQLNKSRFINYTVPMRMGILLHEFSHFYVNEDIENELEADENAMLIYLGLGYPQIDGLLAFNEIFTASPSELNYQRWQKLKEFSEKFEKTPFYIKYT